MKIFLVLCITLCSILGLPTGVASNPVPATFRSLEADKLTPTGSSQISIPPSIVEKVFEKGTSAGRTIDNDLIAANLRVSITLLTFSNSPDFISRFHMCKRHNVFTILFSLFMKQAPESMGNRESSTR